MTNIGVDILQFELAMKSLTLSLIQTLYNNSEADDIWNYIGKRRIVHIQIVFFHPVEKEYPDCRNIHQTFIDDAVVYDFRQHCNK